MSEPKEWKDMPDGIKGMIVKQLDLPARTRFKMCSKANKRLVDSIPFEIEVINALDWNDRPWKEYNPEYHVRIGTVIIRNRCPVKPDGECIASISIDNNATERKFKFPNVEQAQKFVTDTFAQILIHGNVHINQFHTRISCSDVFEKVGIKFKARHIKFGIPLDAEATINWLKNLDPSVEEIAGGVDFGVVDVHIGVGLLPAVINAKNMYFTCFNDINDEQVVEFKATQLNVKCSKVTEKGVNMLMKKWIKEEYPIGSKMEHYIYEFNSDQLFNGLDCETISNSFKEMCGRVVINDQKEFIITIKSLCYNHFNNVEFTAEVCSIQEHKMTNWNDLPYELKWMIVDKMDIFTRFRLKTCSKSDKRLVESIPFYIDEMEVIQLYREETEQGHMGGLRFCFDGVYIELQPSVVRFINKETGNRKLMRFSTQNQAMKMIKDMFAALMAPGNVRIGRFETDWHFHKFPPARDFKLHVNRLVLLVTSDKERQKWLDKVGSGIKELTVVGDINCVNIGSHSVVQNVDHLYVNAINGITDNQLLRSKATKMVIGESKITANGINQLIKKVIDKDYPIGSNLRFKMKTANNWKKLTEGLDVKMVENDEYWVKMSADKCIVACKEVEIGFFQDFFVMVLEQKYFPL